jgi:Sel1 repeat
LDRHPGLFVPGIKPQSWRVTGGTLLYYRWYRQAAEAGVTQAAFNVAVMLDSGAGVPRDGAEAALWYARAAAGGYHRAQYALAQLYAAGDGVPRNPATAEAWYRAAARGGLGAASARLPALLRAGRATASPPPGDLSPVRPVPVAPVDAVLPAGQNSSKVALVWNTPEQPVPVEYYVELRVLDASGSREVSPRATSKPPQPSSSCRASRSATRGASMRWRSWARTMPAAPGTRSQSARSRINAMQVSTPGAAAPISRRLVFELNAARRSP